MKHKIKGLNDFKSRKYNNLKKVFNENIITNTIKDKDFILFFYFKYLNPKKQNELKNLIKKDNNIQIILLKKNKNPFLFNNTNLRFLKNLFKNNLIIIFKKNNEIIEKNIIKTLTKEKQLKLVGGLINKKIVRPSIIENFIKLNNDPKVQITLYLKHSLNKLRFTLNNINK